MNFWRSLAGMVDCELTSADPGIALDAVSRAGITLYQVETDGELSLRFRLARKDWARLWAVCVRRGDSLRLLRRRGLYWTLRGLKKRPVLLMGLAMLLSLVLWLPTRVLFFQVEGNNSVPARQILEAAESCGIRFGASRKMVRSEKMKNALLGKLPQLQWAGINTSGCTAVISVREREAAQSREENDGVYSIVAARDGFITSCTVTSGNALCAPGQTVTAGQTLISPYTDCGICIRVTGAAGEIFAQTRHQIRAVTLSEGTRRTQEGDAQYHISILFGKKRINLWKDSGISPVTCGRIYEEYYLTLPGGFVLPVGVTVETVTSWETGKATLDPEQAVASLAEFARRTVTERMIAGRILSQETSFGQEVGRYTLEGNFLCTEMIGRENRLKIGDTNEQSS